MFDIGFSELVLLMLVGLVVLGPKRLPVAIRTVMGWVKTIRGLAANVQNELKQELKLQELQDSIKKAEQLNLKQLSPDLSKTVEELKEQAQKMRAELEEKAAAAGTTVEDQIKEIKSSAENPADSAEKLEVTPQETAEKPVETASTEHAENETIEVLESAKTEVDLTALEPHEQAELTERLSDYYSPDDVELKPASKSEAKS
ncbi:Sec-independent protein translocase protein TatB [Haemophilus parainfluenzae]|uniref:Sec-independent protein translocase protein TatB n=1 Tax=Haemophilus parainfluenzae HK2019 TaxID=1095746 RepID=A0ABP2NV16_HAEPA|nr:Sec-independent protein translocase protein TatB [Haemophilus parainfluenzae]EIF39743.1 twin arginine-targeting protein translocase TatB [Haemophilus parainfluenzae HK262]EIJ28930.1 twin arginine-targeting protein translocase TatB [Haemophilus parainfluenzae HK2019]MBS5085194.1 Sec-independent protein translocase subunit TatB [Haemophilus parainfluenzae]MDU1944088.1 Sec-independent protein translocase protein TatB [Haemophilus parainfluenzae]MDU2038506.1 Sec-independent protein translocase 